MLAALGAGAVARVAWRQRGSHVSVLSLARAVTAAATRFTPIRNCRIAEAAATNLAGATVNVRGAGKR